MCHVKIRLPAFEGPFNGFLASSPTLAPKKTFEHSVARSPGWHRVQFFPCDMSVMLIRSTDPPVRACCFKVIYLSLYFRLRTFYFSAPLDLRPSIKRSKSSCSEKQLARLYQVPPAGLLDKVTTFYFSAPLPCTFSHKTHAKRKNQPFPTSLNGCGPRLRATSLSL